MRYMIITKAATVLVTAHTVSPMAAPASTATTLVAHGCDATLSGRLQPAPGRTRGPAHPGAHRHRPGHRGSPRPRRPLRERRLPRRQGRSGENGGPYSPAGGHALR